MPSFTEHKIHAKNVQYRILKPPRRPTKRLQDFPHMFSIYEHTYVYVNFICFTLVLDNVVVVRSRWRQFSILISARKVCSSDVNWLRIELRISWLSVSSCFCFYFITNISVLWILKLYKLILKLLLLCSNGSSYIFYITVYTFVFISTFWFQHMCR